MKKKSSRAPKASTSTTTVRLRTGINGMMPMQKRVGAEWTLVYAATSGDIVKLEAAHAARMIAKNRAEKVTL